MAISDDGTEIIVCTEDTCVHFLSASGKLNSGNCGDNLSLHLLMPNGLCDGNFQWTAPRREPTSRNQRNDLVWMLCPDLVLKNTIKCTRVITAAAYSVDKKTFALASSGDYVVREPLPRSLVRT